MPTNPPNLGTIDFPHPAVIVDQFLTERSSSFVGTWTPIEPGQPFVPLNHTAAQVALYSGMLFLGQKAGKDREFQERFWATPPATQDISNYQVEYGAKDTTLPIFKRKYLEFRDTYTPRANLSVLTSLYGVKITAAGLGYNTDPKNPPAVTCNNGATAIAVVNPADGSIAKITLKNEGLNCTTSVTIAAPPAGGVQATAVGLLQPSNCLLTEEAAIPAPDPWGSLYMQVDRTYESLPGDILVDIVPDAELGIPMMTTTQRRAATDSWTNGEIAPIAFNISGATVAVQTVVTLTAPHDFYLGEYVIAVGTSNTTPAMSGGTTDPTKRWKVVAVTALTVTLALDITNISGAIGGTLQRYSYAYVERRKTDNSNVDEMVTTRALTNDITSYNQSTYCPRKYPFPDVLLAAVASNDDSDSNTTELTEIAYAFSYSGSVAFEIQNGYRGTCDATRYRFFSMGPFSQAPINPNTSQPFVATLVQPATGMVTIKGGSYSFRETTTGTTTATSSTAKTETIPPVLTGAFGGIQGGYGKGRVQYKISLPQSVPQRFVQGQLIYDMDETEKLRGGAAYMITGWAIVVPYSTGTPFSDFYYVSSPVSYPSNTAIPTNSFANPGVGTYAGLTATPTLPTGLSLNATTGDITGTPTTPTAQTLYTITGTLNSVAVQGTILLTVT